MFKHIVVLAKEFNDMDEQFIIKLILVEIGVPNRFTGFNMLVQAVSKWRRITAPRITKDIYPCIWRNGVKIAKVRAERSIRTAISRAYSDRDDKWDIYFPENKAPTSTEFIARLAMVVDMWEDCCNTLKAEGGVPDGSDQE